MSIEIPPNLEEMAIRADERQKTEEMVCLRLSQWMDRRYSERADTAFTAGPLRDLARKIEDTYLG